MQKSSFELRNNRFIDSTNIFHNRKLLSDVVSSIPICGKDGYSKNIFGEDLNNIKSTGFYYGNNLINGPLYGTENAMQWGYLEVVNYPVEAGYCLQKFYSQMSDMNIYLRKLIDGVWTNWVKIPYENI